MEQPNDSSYNNNNKSKISSNVSQNSIKVRFQEFFINDNEKNKASFKHKNNLISTTKYNIFTYLPKSFLIQFARLPNIYFLACAIIQSIPIISPLTGVTAIVPLIFVLSVSMIRELIEDISRYKYDKLNNEDIVTVFRDGKFVKSNSASLRLGEVIIVYDNSTIPADMILMDSGLHEGVCYIETSTLDGEKALKEKIAHKATYGFFSSISKRNLIEECTFKLSGYCQCDYPNPDLNHLDGKLKLNYNGSETNIPISTSQMLLKGSVIKHSSWVGGFVLYTGLNNKIILNSKPPRMKISKIEKTMSRFLIGVFGFQLLLSAICSISHYTQYENHIEFYNHFIQLDQQPSLESFITFFTYLLLLNTLIPISLIITLEIVKITQGFFLKWDCEMYSRVKKKFCKASSVSLNEELGNVNYIFSDKTGTLTSNKMQFKYCVIGETFYEYIKKDSNGMVNDEKKRDENIKMLKKEQKLKIIPIGQNYFYNFIKQNSEPRNNKSEFKTKLSDEAHSINEFWKALACAHECVCSETDNGLEYSGVSPDDVELVKTASSQGYSLLKSQSDERKILIGAEEKTYKILNIINFSSERKRMSIILRDGDQIKIYTKGADCEIKRRLSQKTPQNHIDAIIKGVDKFSGKGYRTLMIGTKIIEEDVYAEWNNKLRSGEMNLAKKHALLESCYDEMENKLLLLGATMVEDKLQDSVPETIRDLRLAGIKIWVLTGDKIDTAENIALSCNLISKTHRNFKICAMKGELNRIKSNINSELEKFENEFKEFIYNEEEYRWSVDSSQKSDDGNNPYKKVTTPFSILIEAPILGGIFKHDENTKKFLKIALCASTVVCCRVSPLQKSQVVKKVKTFDPKSITLAIGDGGNDVSMIMEAHIGVGVYGEEGMRAVQASDFAIGEFKILRRLLLFHGRTNSNRISAMILYFFYKNFVFTMTHFFFSFNCLFSGQTIIDDWFITFYNLIFTALPLGVQACSDFDIKEEDGKLISDMLPFLYKESRDVPIFNILNFFKSLLKGLILGLISFFLIIYSVSSSAIDSDGNTENLWYCSMSLYTNIIFSVSFTLLLQQRYMIALMPIVMGITSWGIYIAFIFYVHFTLMFNSFGTMVNSFQSQNFYYVIILFLGISFVVDYFKESIGFLFSEKMSTQLMIMTHKKQLESDTLPDLIITAKTNYDLISRYNNYNLIKNNNSFSDSKSRILKEDLSNLSFHLNKKSKSQKQALGKNGFEMSVMEQQDDTHFSKKIESVFHSDDLNRDKKKRIHSAKNPNCISSMENNEDEGNTINANVNLPQIQNNFKLALKSVDGDYGNYC